MLVEVVLPATVAAAAEARGADSGAGGSSGRKDGRQGRQAWHDGRQEDRQAALASAVLHLASTGTGIVMDYSSAVSYSHPPASRADAADGAAAAYDDGDGVDASGMKGGALLSKSRRRPNSGFNAVFASRGTTTTYTYSAPPPQESAVPHSLNDYGGGGSGGSGGLDGGRDGGGHGGGGVHGDQQHPWGHQLTDEPFRVIVTSPREGDVLPLPLPLPLQREGVPSFPHSSPSSLSSASSSS